MKKQTIELPAALENWYTSQFPTNRQGIKQAVSSYYENLNDHPMVSRVFSPKASSACSLTPTTA